MPALRLVPALPTHVHRFDLLGVLLSATGMFLLVFGISTCLADRTGRP